ncbi:putative LPS assembly protein LptD [Pseudofulvibacter geojedonensis]|uniref:LPS assembly protein LptD n=1 Tax=Pseudofulvibacter geojedonensis TaxID=1123758 RepID=A0ABW3I2T4_9FLAO
MTLQKLSHTFTKIVDIDLQTKSLHILLVTFLTLFINNTAFGQDIPKSGIPIKGDDTAIEKEVTKMPKSTEFDQLNTKEVDTIRPKDSIKVKETLTDVVNYKATDYIKINRREKQMYLYNNAEISYEDMNIKAGKIIINYAKSEVYAFGIKDSTGYIQRPIFKQGDSEVEPDSIRYNFNTQKALVFNSRTEQNGMNVKAAITKKVNDSTIFIKEAWLTTSKDLDDPEYHIRIRKGKFVPKKKIVSGFANMYIYQIPTPIGIPFAYFPLTEDRASGFIVPTFGENSNRGYFLQNGGYYFAINDYFDLTLLGDYYTNGSYGYNLSSNYKVNYKFNGQFSFRYENLINSERGFPDYSKSTIYNIRWSHSQDAKANPNSRFSASVNLGSSNYYNNSINQFNIGNNLTNTLSSSISYNKSFPGSLGANFSATATHSQNTNTEQINMSLPNVQGSINRIYPFEPKTGSKKGIIQNINFQYSFTGQNRINTTDEFFFKKEMFDDAKMGIRHSIPVNTNFKVFDYLSVSAGGTYNEVWNFEKVRKFYDNTLNKEVTEVDNGFASYRTYNFSSSVGTTLYGMYNFDKEDSGKKIKAIRHVVRPSISYNVNPSFDFYYEQYLKEVTDADGTQRFETIEYSPFENSIYGSPGKTYSSSIGLGIGNSIEAKVREKETDSTEIKYRKVSILNNLNISTSYNLAGDSLQISPVAISGGTQLMKNKMNINFGMSLDPYALDNNNTRIDKFNIDNGGSLFRLTNANFTLNYSFSSSDFDKKSDNKNSDPNTSTTLNNTEDLLGQRNGDLSKSSFDDNEDDEQKDVKLYNYKIPWSLRLAYSAAYNNFARQNEISRNSLMASGDVELSPRWKVGVSSGYDFKQKGITATNLRFERDLLSWKMNFQWFPFGLQKSWFFFIGIKSSVLSDIKWEKRRERDKVIN